jgi:hypothetical protein
MMHSRVHRNKEIYMHVIELESVERIQSIAEHFSAAVWA